VEFLVYLVQIFKLEGRVIILYTNLHHRNCRFLYSVSSLQVVCYRSRYAPYLHIVLSHAYQRKLLQREQNVVF